MYHESWSDQAKDEFEKCVKAHGGWSAWNEFDEFIFRFRKFSGALLFAKGLGQSFFTPKLVRVNPKTKSLVFEYDSHQDSYLDGELIFSPAKKKVKDGKSLFSGKTFEQWRPEHALYFFGFAVVNYTGYPFILSSCELLNFSKHGDGFLFDIKFPPEVRTHSEVQRFYFNKNYLLARHDYRSRLAGPFVYGAHETENYKSYKDLQIPQTRKVKARIGRLGLRPYGIYAELDF